MGDSINTLNEAESPESKETAQDNELAAKKTNDDNDSESKMGSGDKTQKVSEIIVAIVLLGFSAWWGFIAYTTHYPPSARRMGTISSMAIPKVALTILFIISLLQVIKSVRWMWKHSKEVKRQKITLFEGKIPLLALSLVLFAVFWNIIGFSLTSFLEFVFVAKYLEPGRKTRNVILVGLVFTISIVILFGLFFKIPFYDPLTNALNNMIRSSR